MTIKTALIAAGTLIAASAAAIPSARADGLGVGLYFGTPHAGFYITDRDRHRHARPHHFRRHVLAPRIIRRQLRRHGFHRVVSLDLRGPVYVARAVARRGVVYRVTLDARTGRILRQYAVHRPRGHDRLRGH